MPVVADADAAVEHLVSLDRRGRLPFEWYQIGPYGGRVEVAVPSRDHAAALAFFADQPFLRPDGTPLPVEVSVRAGDSWGVEPEGGALDHPDPDALVGLVGMDVHEAASRASAGGWLVRAHEPDAVLTADLRMNRVNLVYSAVDRVVSVTVG